MALSDDLVSAQLRHAVYVERYKARIVREILSLVADVEDSISATISREDLESLSQRQLDELLSGLRRTISDGYEPVTEFLERELEAFAEYEGAFQAKMLNDTVPVDISFASPAPAQIYAAAVARPFQGLLLREWYQGLPDGQFRRVRAAIRMGYVDGKTTGEIVREIIGTRKRPGIIEQSRRGAEAAVRTAIAHTANVAAEETWKANREVLKGLEWVSTLDGRTSAICRAYDGRVFPLDDGPRPPAHVNCRSRMSPLVKSAKQLGLKDIPKTTRASMNGQVSGDLNYDAWLRTQPRDFQDEVLGKKKAQLFRSGLKVDRFIDASGQEYTLAELKDRESRIWARSFGE